MLYIKLIGRIASDLSIPFLSGVSRAADSPQAKTNQQHNNLPETSSHCVATSFEIMAGKQSVKPGKFVTLIDSQHSAEYALFLRHCQPDTGRGFLSLL